jgi:hypothetical protein
MSVQKNVIGMPIKATVKEDGVAVNLTSATVKKIFLGAPSGQVKEKTAEFFTTGADGILKYVTIADDLDESGVWSIQAYVELASGFKGPTSIGKFSVGKNLKG